MTKTRKRWFARQIRKRLSIFIDVQIRDVAAAIAKTRDPDQLGMTCLYEAQALLNTLISELRAEGYGNVE